MSEVRCNTCRSWFHGDAAACPGCGHERPGWNRALHVSMLNSHLYKQAEAAIDGDRRYRQSIEEEHMMCRRYGIEPGGYPTRETVGRELSAATSAAH